MPAFFTLRRKPGLKGLMYIDPKVGRLLALLCNLRKERKSQPFYLR